MFLSNSMDSTNGSPTLGISFSLDTGTTKVALFSTDLLLPAEKHSLNRDVKSEEDSPFSTPLHGNKFIMDGSSKEIRRPFNGGVRAKILGPRSKRTP